MWNHSFYENDQLPLASALYKISINYAFKLCDLYTKIVVRQHRTVKKSGTAFAVPAGPSTPW